MMTSRERVRKAVTFQGPDRVPVELPEQFHTDFVRVNAYYDPDWQPKIQTETEWEDEWGCIWHRLSGDISQGQVKHFPISYYGLLDDYVFPNYKKRSRYGPAKKIIAENTDEKFVLAKVPLSFIHRLEYLRGHEQAWTDPYLFPNQLNCLLDKLADIAIDAIDNFAELGVDGIFSNDDWGIQDRPHVDPDIFREFWAPRYKRVYHHAHEKGILTFLHSCGYIIDLLPHFIEAELDVIQMDQQENMGIENLAKRVGGRICFWCPVDIQNVMVNRTTDDVKAYVRKLIDKLGCYNGGFIAKWYGDPEVVGHGWEKVTAMCEAFVEYGSIVYAAPNSIKD